MQFVIRDDDLNFFSTPADIERWYADVFVQKIPVSFATIPLVRGMSDVYTNNAPKDEREYPLGNNAELCSYLKNNPLIEVMQHGTTHVTKDGVYEYARTQGLVEETLRGKAELERALGKAPRVFAPPHDWIGTHGVIAVEAAGLDVIRGRGAGLRNWLWRRQYAVIFVKMLWYRALHHFAYPHVLNFGKHRELCSYRVQDSDVFEGLAYAHKKDGIFVVVMHLHAFTDEKKKRLLELIKQARGLGAQFVLPGAIFS
jgi:peptidoglycan/xylan/chitin deacetylase (PgdA/CDA1 family)